VAREAAIECASVEPREAGKNAFLQVIDGHTGSLQVSGRFPIYQKASGQSRLAAIAQMTSGQSRAHDSATRGRIASCIRD
jgi:hypothetical protein